MRFPLRTVAPTPLRRRKNSAALTCVDVLVALVICAALGMMFLSTISKSSHLALRAQCRNNELHQLAALSVYGSENKDLLPINQFENWAWDVSAITTAQLVAAGASKSDFYDPGTRPKFGPSDWNALWIFNAPDPLSNPAEAGFRVLGYAQTLAGPGAFQLQGPYSGIYASNINVSFTATTALGTFPAPVHIGPTSRRVLVACATLTETGNSDVYQTMVQYNWASVPGGYNKQHISAHMGTTAIPDGGNVGMLDGHAEWRPFNQMINRVSSAPYFYY